MLGGFTAWMPVILTQASVIGQEPLMAPIDVESAFWAKAWPPRPNTINPAINNDLIFFTEPLQQCM